MTKPWWRPMFDDETRARLVALARERGFKLSIFDNPMHPQGFILIYEHPVYPHNYKAQFDGGHERTWTVHVKNWDSAEYVRINTALEAASLLLEEWRKDVDRGAFPLVDANGLPSFDLKEMRG